MGLDRGLNSSSTNPLGIDDDDYTATTRGAQGPQGDDGASTQDYIDKYNTVVSSAAAASVNETNSATSATSSANSATASASSASASSTSKDTSTAQATIATTKAGEASTSATNSATSATNSANSATASASSASTAATQATLATTNGAAQVALATTQAGLATTNGAAQVTLATAQASTATTKASEAATSATNSATSATSSASSATASANSATAAASSATGAASSATTATTKASEASTSATASAASLASFTGQYVSQATAPSSPSEGDLWFDTTANTMKVYDGSGFINAGSSVNGIENSVQHTATAGQTSFTATYDAGFLQVYLNGLRLDAEDYTATNGSTVVLDTGATLNDVVFIHSFGTFVLANTYTQAQTNSLLDAKLDDSQVGTTANKLVALDGSAKLPAVDGSQLTGLVGGGKVLQVANFQTGTVATGTTVLPYDDTIPQITEGNEYMTLAFTPTDAGSTLLIQIVCQANSTEPSGNGFTTALFVGTTANALASMGFVISSGFVSPTVFTHKMTAGVTSALTFRVRAGGATSGTTTFCGNENGSTKLNGTIASSITITEVAA